jgi:CoA:oxalate CoA-transferase
MTADPAYATDRKGPLAGVRVIDLSRILAGPYCTMLMAELGAEVIKVEPPGIGDDARAYGPFVHGRSAYFMSVNRGKRSIALDLKRPEDRTVFDRLLATGDVLVENFRPGTMEKLGYGWDVVHAKHPRLIYAAASGFGHTGPYATYPAYDMVVQGLGGIMSVTGTVGAPLTRVGMSIGDIGAGLYTAIAVNAALYDRALTGVASKVDIGMFDCQLALLENAVMRYTTTGEVPGKLGARHPTITPFAAFRTADGHLIIAAGNDSLFQKLADALDKPEWKADPRYATNQSRLDNYGRLLPELEAVLTTRPTAAWQEVLEKAGVPCGPVNDVAGALAHPQVRARNMVVTVEDPVAGPVKLVGNPLKLSAYADPPTRPAAPALDQDRQAILAELGL